ncbi:hypothetical protein [Parapedobacter sp. 10938]|uniref:hypothetical protein n=1 Tax=Parapedobacter flavus TaxID=3110225 RepID=UPI002DBC7D5E|nr:hypothetical protein [Parapedobacter sp. 10938]MEC3881174.1 hypothetical protein [Parapedobacter sp. 10938]
MKSSNYNLEKLSSKELLDLAKFVVTENFKHHVGTDDPVEYECAINCIYADEQGYFDKAQIFVSKGFDRSIIGSIRVLRWNYIDVLPIQRIFGINPLDIDDSPNCRPIWHIGRFAIKKGSGDVNLLKQLMVCAIASVCEDENAIAYAECDCKLLRVLAALGINAHPLGNAVNYLGSGTIPIRMTYGNLIDFYCKHKFIVPKGILGTNDTKHENYTLV